MRKTGARRCGQPGSPGGSCRSRRGRTPSAGGMPGSARRSASCASSVCRPMNGVRSGGSFAVGIPVRVSGSRGEGSAAPPEITARYGAVVASSATMPAPLAAPGHTPHTASWQPSDRRYGRISRSGSDEQARSADRAPASVGHEWRHRRIAGLEPGHASASPGHPPIPTAASPSDRSAIRRIRAHRTA